MLKEFVFKKGTPEKRKKIDQFVKMASAQENYAIFSTVGLKAGDADCLRKEIRDNGTKAIIMKNTLLNIANKELSYPHIELKGNNIVVFDVIKACNTVSKLKHLKRQLKLHSVVDKNILIQNKSQLNLLNKITNPNQIVGTLLGTIRTPIVKLIKLLQIKTTI